MEIEMQLGSAKGLGGQKPGVMGLGIGLVWSARDEVVEDGLAAFLKGVDPLTTDKSIERVLKAHGALTVDGISEMCGLGADEIACQLMKLHQVDKKVHIAGWANGLTESARVPMYGWGELDDKAEPTGKGGAKRRSVTRGQIAKGKIEEVMRRGMRLTSFDASEIGCVCERSARMIILGMRAEMVGVRIAGWAKRYAAGPYIPVYEMKSGADVPAPVNKRKKAVSDRAIAGGNGVAALA